MSKKHKSAHTIKKRDKMQRRPAVVRFERMLKMERAHVPGDEDHEPWPCRYCGETGMNCECGSLLHCDGCGEEWEECECDLPPMRDSSQAASSHGQRESSHDFSSGRFPHIDAQAPACTSAHPRPPPRRCAHAPTCGCAHPYVGAHACATDM